MASEDSDDGRRHVPVPLAIYKVVTTVTTLLGVVGVVAGLSLIDRGTDRGGAAPDEINVPLTVLGVGLILGAALMYIFSTRFRPVERTNDKTPSTESDDNG